MGSKVDTKSKLIRQLGDTVDLSSFDFQTGRNVPNPLHQQSSAIRSANMQRSIIEMLPASVPPIKHPLSIEYRCLVFTKKKLFSFFAYSNIFIFCLDLIITLRCCPMHNFQFFLIILSKLAFTFPPFYLALASPFLFRFFLRFEPFRRFTQKQFHFVVVVCEPMYPWCHRFVKQRRYSSNR